MKKSAVFFVATFGALLSGQVVFGQGSETALIVRLTDGTFIAGPKVGSVVPTVKTIQPADVGSMIALAAEIVLRARIEPCATQDPSQCNGAENFHTVVDPEDPSLDIYGCADMVDNDADGKVDAEDEDCRVVQGFSMSVNADVCFGISRATTLRTIAALNSANPPGIRDPDGSFEKTEVVNPALNGGQPGAVCAVVFSFTKPLGVQLGDAVVLKLTGGNLDTTGLTPGQMTAPCLIRIQNPDENGLVGSGEPVKTAVTVAGETSLPDICNLTFKVAVEEGPPPPPPLSDTAFRIDVVSPTAVAGAKVPDVPGSPNGTIPYVATLPVPPPANPQPVQVAVTLISRLPFCIQNPGDCDGDEDFHTIVDPEDPSLDIYGCADMVDNDADGKTDAEDEDCQAIQGFSASLATDPCFGISRATTLRTVAALNSSNPPGIRDPDGSFEKTEVINPALNGGQQGAVSAVVFSFTKPLTLDQVSENTVVLLSGAIDTSAINAPGAMTAPCGVQVVSPDAEGLKGSGEPVKTAVTVAGNTSLPNTCHASLKLMGANIPPPPVNHRFLRCDPNDDGKNNIADAVWIVNELFRMGPQATCQDAADCNDQGVLIDVSDAQYCIMYQFLNGPTPPPPFAACGMDPTEEEPALSCPEDVCTP